jgi:hypothetical protein
VFVEWASKIIADNKRLVILAPCRLRRPHICARGNAKWVPSLARPIGPRVARRAMLQLRTCGLLSMSGPKSLAQRART